LIALAPLHADLLVKPNDTVLVAAEAPMMQGWLSVDIAMYFMMCQPVEGLKVVQLNDGGEEVEPFMRRIDRDVAVWHPNVVLFSHGIGDGREDIHGQGYTHYHPLYMGMTLDALKKLGVRTIVLGSANCVDSTQFPGDSKTYNANLAAFKDQDHQIADKAGVMFVDQFTPMLDAMTKAKAAYGDGYYLTQNEGRGPNRNAQLIMAYVFLKALGCDGNLATITVDLAANKAEGTAGQKVLSMQNGTVQLESTRYPYCFQGDAKDPDATTGIINFFPFNDELNRYLLVVKGLTGARAKVTWGAEVREFPVADLAKGVNLAAAFAGHTPFDNHFTSVEDAIWQQQLKQFIFMDNIFQHLDDFKEMAPGAPFDKLVAGIYAQNDKNGAEATARFVPVQHTIKIDPLLILAGAFLTGVAARADLLLQPNDVVAIAGDSITQQKIYSVDIEDYLLMCQPAPGLSTYQFGSNGAGAYVLGSRTPNDLVYFHPTVVTMLYGMNDGQYKPLSDDRSKGFRDGTVSSIEAVKKIGVRVILVSSPTCTNGPKDHPIKSTMYNQTLGAFGDMAREIAKNENVPFTDTHNIMFDVITKGEAVTPDYSLGGDGVHQGPAGHLVMAYSMLKGLGCDGAIGTITVDLAKNTAEGTPGQKIVSVKDGVIQIESTRYPFCFTGDPTKPDTTTNLDVLKYLPFNEDLNRYMLVVHGLTTPKAKVTWGATSQEFSAADLAKGVNLAAAFAPTTPFSDQFAKVDAAVLAQQKQETALAKDFMSDFGRLKDILPDQTAILDEIVKRGKDKRDELAKAAAALVIPIDHTLTITPIP
jgi:lysophospholipase L1-like esterase